MLMQKPCNDTYKVIALNIDFGVKSKLQTFYLSLTLDCPKSLALIYTRQKKRIQYNLQNYNQLRSVDKIFIFERSLL